LDVNRQLPLIKQYEDIGLWRIILRNNVILHKKTKKILSKKSSSQATEEEEDAPKKANQQQQEFQRSYMEMLYDQFGEEIRQINKAENYDAKRLATLIECLETGVDLFSPIDQRGLLISNNSKQSTKR